MGYGGTKSEMERLLADAQELTGQTYDINNLGDVYNAIHAIQGDLGLTGVAAEEASQTFSGSFAAMKASAQNLLGSIAVGENVQPAMEQLITSASTFFFGNFIPMIGTLISSLPGAIVTFVTQGIPTLLSGLMGVITTIASSVKSMADSLSGAKVAEWASTMLPKILSAAGSVIGNFAKGLITNLPKIVASIGRIGLAIITGLGSAIWGKVKAAAEGVKEKFMQPIESLKEKIKGIIEKIKGFFNFNIPTPHVPLPHFTISPAGWKLSDLLKGVKPSLSVSWYAKGGIVDGATLIGAGEKGPEAIVPLDSFWKKLEQTAGAGDNITINVYANEGMDVNAVASAVEQRLIQMQRRRTMAWQ